MAEKHRRFPSSRFVQRAIIVLAVSGALFWLVRDARRATGRSIDTALRAERIGVLRPEERNELRNTITWLMGSIEGVAGTFGLDEPYEVGRLNIYTVGPNGASLTGCEEGNAIYKADEDVIFLDHNLARLGIGSWGNQNVFFSLVFLHELAHRVLHGKTLGMYDSSARDLEESGLELEADEFAYERLREAYAEDLSRDAARIGDWHRKPPGLDDFPLDDSLRFSTDLVIMARDFTPDQMRAPDPFSPLYSDVVHPTLVERLDRLLGLVHADTASDDSLLVHCALVREELKRILDARRGSVVEVTIPEPIVDLVWSQNAVNLVSKSGGVFSLRRAVLQEQLSAAFTRLRIGTDRRVGGGLEEVLAAFSSENGRILSIDRGGVLRVFEGGAWNERQRIGEVNGPCRVVRLIKDSSLSDTFQVLTIPDEGDEFLGLMDEDNESAVLHSFVGARHRASRPVADVEEEIARQFGVAKCRLKLGGSSGRDIYCLVRDGTSTPWALEPLGVGLLDPSSLRLISSLRLHDALPADGLCVRGTSDGKSEVALVGMDYDGEAMGWLVQIVRPDGSTRRAAKGTWMTDLLDKYPDVGGLSDLRRGYDPRFMGAVFADSRHLLISYAADSIFEADLESGESRVFFHPGGGRVQPCEGLVSVLPGLGSSLSNRCYFLRLAIEDSSLPGRK